VKIDDFALFREIAHRRSVSQGAAAQGITQSAASQHLKELERRFRVPFVDRSRRPLELTPAGEAYLAFCESTLRRWERLGAEVSVFQQTVEGVVHLAAIYSVGLSEVASLREEFRRRAPQATLEVEYLRPDAVYEAILEDRADVGIVSYPQASREITVIPWREEEMVVAAAPSHPLAQFPSLHLTNLEGVEFVAFESTLPIQRHIERFLREHQVNVRTVLHLDNIDSIREAIEQGVGVGIVPKPVLKSHAAKGLLRAIQIVPRSLRRPLGIVHRRRKKFSRVAESFIALLREAGLPPQALKRA
jgi:DNA-binding transcriptional LysR family regulator